MQSIAALAFHATFRMMKRKSFSPGHLFISILGLPFGAHHDHGAIILALADIQSGC